MGVTIRRLVAALLALSLLAACGGGDGDDDAARSSSDKASTTTTPDGKTSSGTDGADDDGKGSGPTVTSGEKPTPIDGGGSSGAGNTGGGGSTDTTPTTSGSVPPRTGNERTATPGTYTYNRTRDGSPTQGTLVVHRPQGADQRFVTTYQGGEAAETLLRSRSGGIDLLLLKTTTPLLGTEEYRPSPPVQFAPDPAPVGTTWSWRITSTDGDQTLDGTFRVARTERLTIGGEAVDTVVFESTVNVSGDNFTGTLHQTTWASPKYRLVVRGDERLESSFLRYTQSAVLASTRPA